MIKAKRIQLKKEIWPYPKDTILVSYCGDIPNIYYVETDKNPNGNGLNIQWFTAQGMEYTDGYFKHIDPVDFDATVWADKLKEQLKLHKNKIENLLKETEKKYEQDMRGLNDTMTGIEQAYVTHFGLPIDTPVVDCTDKGEKEEEAYKVLNKYEGVFGEIRRMNNESTGSGGWSTHYSKI